MFSRVFVYGTLMSGMHNHCLIRPYLETITRGKMKGILFDLPYGFPAVIPGKGTVYGEIMELRNINEAIIVLDRLEGYHGKKSNQNLYNRVVQDVEILNGETVPAYLYFWARPEDLFELGTVVPGGDWKTFKDCEGEKI